MPAPMTSAVEPGVGAARFREWIATESGSRSAAASKETWSGILRLRLVNSSEPLEVEDLLVTPDSRMIDPLL